MRVAISGHRPERIDNWQYVETQLKHAFFDLDARHVIQGMAAGVDLVSARFAYQMHIPYTAAVPWRGHTPRQEDRFQYEQALKHAAHIHYVSDALDFQGPWMYHDRNHWMVDHANVLIAVWDGRRAGGTYACTKYAIKKGVPVWHINPKEYKVGWLKPASVE